MEPWAELVELYEYKVADMLAGRDPRGGRRSLVALRETLLHGTLESPLLRRFRHADKLWREYSVAATPPPASHPASAPMAPMAFDDWSLQSQPPTDTEGKLLEQLATRLWRLRLDDQLTKLVMRWRREPGLTTLRAVYALSLNLESGKVAYDVPSENDPLVSLDNPRIATNVLSTLIEQLIEYRSETLTPVAWGRTIMLQLAHNPFPQATRAILEQGSATQRTAPPSRNLERTQIREALARGFEAITRLLPPSLGGTGDEPVILTRALFATSPQRSLPVPDDSTTLAVRLAGPGEIHWQQLMLGWQQVGRDWHFTAAGAVYPLKRGENEPGITRIPLDGVELRVLYLEDYLLLSVEQGEHASLGALLTLGRPVAALLDATDDYLHLRLARGVAQWLRDGRVDSSALSAQHAAKYAAAPHENLLAFARKGAENLLSRLERRTEEESTRAFREVARALRCPEERALRLLQLLRAAQGDSKLTEVQEVAGDHEVALVAYRGEPVTVKVAGRSLTLRADYRGEVTAVLPGSPALPVHDLQVFTLPHGSVIIARQGLRLAVGCLLAAPVA